MKYYNVPLECLNAVRHMKSFDERFAIIEKFGQENFDNSSKKLQNYYAVVRRLRSRIKEWYMGNQSVYFATFTYSDDNACLAPYLINLAQDVLYDVGCEYVLNEDYGEENQRLHVHGILASYDQINITQEMWPFGFFSVKHVEEPAVDGWRRLAVYIAKMAYHCAKDTAARRAYSRLNARK